MNGRSGNAGDPTAEFFATMQQTGASSVIVNGTEVRRGSRVRLTPHPGGDVLDSALSGRLATVEGIDEDESGMLHIAVTLDDDPGRDLGNARQPGHRFFFAADEIEAIDEEQRERILVAGIGNVFFGDDGFGVAVAQAMQQSSRAPVGVDVADFGIRSMDLAYALQSYDTAILIDASRRGEPPGTLTVIQACIEQGAAAVSTHGMDPLQVMRLAQTLGRVPARVLVVTCEPERVPDGDREEDLTMDLSPPVRAAVDTAVPLIESLVAQLIERKVVSS